MKLAVIEEEAILRSQDREIGILAAHEELTITRARYSPGEQVAGPHVHNGHTDAFYVLEGELTFEIGRESEMITVPAGGFVAVPAGVAHSLGNRGEHPARWLTIHAPDGGFAAFMRGLRTAPKSRGTSPWCPPTAACLRGKRSSAWISILSSPPRVGLPVEPAVVPARAERLLLGCLET